MAGQTLSEIRSLLAAAGLTPQHRYGQNFLIDLNLIRKLVAAAEVSAADVILEVGPGTGSLTEVLLERGPELIAVEIDRGLQALLRQRFGANPRFTLIQGDALAGKHQVNPLVLQVLNERAPAAGGGRKLVANLPYQIATPLLMELLYAAPRLERMVCTIQREVGDRLSAPPRTDAYGPVSVITQSLAEVELVAILPAAVFWPRPEVESIMLSIRPLPRERIAIEDIPDFVRFVQLGFQQRRKMIRRLLRERPPIESLAIFARAEVNPDWRPEELSPAQWRALHRSLRAAAN